MRDQIGTECPGGVDVPKGLNHVRHIGAHHAFIGPLIGEIDSVAIYRKFSPPQDQQIKTCSGDNNVGLKILARLE